MSAWSRTPPTEPGYYWVRDRDIPSDITVAEVWKIGTGKLNVMFMGSDWAKSLDKCDEEEWWPIPIEPPAESDR